MAKKRQIRTTKLDPEFENGYAKDWYMAVPIAFRDELDIKHTARVENKKDVMRWTQGVPPLYAFNEGHLFYRDTDDYHRWPASHVQVDRATSDTWDEKNGFSPGYVFVKFFRPVEGESRVELEATAQFSQASFVHFLRTGEKKKMKAIHPDF